MTPLTARETPNTQNQRWRRRGRRWTAEHSCVKLEGATTSETSQLSDYARSKSFFRGSGPGSNTERRHEFDTNLSHSMAFIARLIGGEHGHLLLPRPTLPHVLPRHPLLGAGLGLARVAAIAGLPSAAAAAAAIAPAACAFLPLPPPSAAHARWDSTKRKRIKMMNKHKCVPGGGGVSPCSP